MDHAKAVARRLSAELKKAYFTTGGSCPEDKKIIVTISCGIAQFRDKDTLDFLTSRADVALYAAKNKGRDRIVDETGSDVTFPV